MWFDLSRAVIYCFCYYYYIIGHCLFLSMKLKCCPALCLFALKKKKKFDYLCIIIYYSIHANVRTGRNEEISFFSLSFLLAMKFLSVKKRNVVVNVTAMADSANKCGPPSYAVEDSRKRWTNMECTK